MFSELLHTNKLSKRFRRDTVFKTTLFPYSRVCLELEKNTSQDKDEQKSIFDSEEYYQDRLKNAETQTQLKKVWLATKKYYFTEQILTRKRLDRTKQHRKKLFFVPLDTKTQLNPMKQIKFFDYKMPQDSSIFEDIPYQDDLGIYNIFDMSDYKQVKQVTYDHNRKVFTTNTYEKHHTKSSNFYYRKSRQYYLSWLRSLGNKRAFDLSETLEEIQNNYEKSKEKYLESEQALKDSCNNSMISKIRIKSLESILKLPYLARTTKIESDATSEVSGIVEEEISMELLKLMGFSEEDKADIGLRLLKFMLYKSVSVLDIYSALKMTVPNKRLADIDDSGNLPKSGVRILLKDRYGNNAVESGVVRFEDRWYENGFVYKRTYIVFNDIKFTNAEMEK